MSRWTALLLAGSRPQGDPLARSMMLGHKALIPVAGEPMVLRPLRTLLDSPRIAEVIVLTQDPEDLRPVLPADRRMRIEASRATIAATIAELIHAGTARFPVLGQRNPARIASSFGGTLNLIASMLLVSIVVAGIGLVIAATVLIQKQQTSA